MTETGFPGRPKNGVSPTAPKTTGLPGWIMAPVIVSHRSDGADATYNVPCGGTGGNKGTATRVAKAVQCVKSVTNNLEVEMKTAVPRGNKNGSTAAKKQGN